MSIVNALDFKSYIFAHKHRLGGQFSSRIGIVGIIMTVSYSWKIGTANRFGAFGKLLFV